MESKYVAGPPGIARFDFSRVNGSNADRTQKRIELASEFLWNLGEHPEGVTFASLTKKQKLDVVADYLQTVITDMARNQTVRAKQSTASADAIVEFEAN